MESGRRDLEKRIRLNVNLDDVLYALRKKKEHVTGHVRRFVVM